MRGQRWTPGLGAEAGGWGWGPSLVPGAPRPWRVPPRRAPAKKGDRRMPYALGCKAWGRMCVLGGGGRHYCVCNFTLPWNLSPAATSGAPSLHLHRCVNPFPVGRQLKYLPFQSILSTHFPRCTRYMTATDAIPSRPQAFN